MGVYKNGCLDNFLLPCKKQINDRRYYALIVSYLELNSLLFILVIRIIRAQNTIYFVNIIKRREEKKRAPPAPNICRTAKSHVGLGRVSDSF